jgi:hypothetical protein
MSAAPSTSFSPVCYRPCHGAKLQWVNALLCQPCPCKKGESGTDANWSRKGLAQLAQLAQLAFLCLPGMLHSIMTKTCLATCLQDLCMISCCGASLPPCQQLLYCTAQPLHQAYLHHHKASKGSEKGWKELYLTSKINVGFPCSSRHKEKVS